MQRKDALQPDNATQLFVLPTAPLVCQRMAPPPVNTPQPVHAGGVWATQKSCGLRARVSTNLAQNQPLLLLLHDNSPAVNLPATKGVHGHFEWQRAHMSH